MAGLDLGGERGGRPGRRVVERLDLGGDGVVLVGEEPALAADVLGVGGGPLGEQPDEVGVRRDEAVVAEVADRDPEPMPILDLGDGVGGEVARLTGA